MKTNNLLAAALVCTLAFTTTQAQQVPQPKTAADVPGPVAGQIMTEEYAATLARFAYMWAWPMMNMHNRRDAFDKVPEPIMLGVVPAAPPNQMGMLTDYIDPAERIVATPNQDVVYGISILSLDREPVVVQVPDFGQRFWVYQLCDQRTEGFGRLGAMYGSKPGFYLLVGPNWNGKKPEGIQAVMRCPTTVGAIFPRVFMDDGPADHQAVQPLVSQINAYPLSKFTGKMVIRDWSQLKVVPSAGGSTETKWVLPETFFAQLPKVLDEVPALPGEEAIYAQLRTLLKTAQANPIIMETLTKVAQETERELFGPLFNWRNQGLPLAQGWTKMANGACWGFDYMTRASAAKANIFCNAPNETMYFALDLDPQGVRLNGGKSYTITFAKGQTPPVKGFWSLTMYNEHHFFEPNSIQRYSVGTKNKDLQFAADGSLTIYMSNEAPTDAAQRANWLPAPKGDFSLYIRSYWPEAAITDGKWIPPAVVQTAQAQPAPASTNATKVTYDNFVVAETDKYFSNHVKEHPVNTIRHSREMSNVKNQVVIRENQDILYSHAVVDISEGATLINPPWDLYSVIQVIDEQHYTIGVVYSGETLTITKSMVELGNHVFLNIRTAVRTLDAKGYAEAHKHQDSIQIKAKSAKAYITKGFDSKTLDAVRADLASRGTEISHPEKMFGTKADVDDRMTFLIASAGGWAGLPVKDACYVTNIQPEGKAKNGEPSSITLPVPPLKYDKGGFFSVTTYDKAGWIVKEKFALNNRQATPNPDGSYTFNFNSPGKPNNIDVEKDWTLLIRFYVPKSLDEILAYTKSLSANVKIVAQ